MLAWYRSVDLEIKEIENDDDDTLGIELKTKMIQKLNQTKKSLANKIANMELEKAESSFGDEEGLSKSNGDEALSESDSNDSINLSA